MVTSVVSLAAGVCFASLYYEQAAALVHTGFGGNPTVDAVGAYLALFAVAFAIVELLGASIIRLLHAVHLGWADRLAGSALGAAVAALLAGLAVTMLTALMPAGATMLERSRLAPKVLVYNSELVRYVPNEIKDAYESKRSQLMRYWMQAEKGIYRRSVPPQAPATPPSSR